MKINLKKITYVITFILLFAVLWWRSKYGIASGDECFYLTVPYRMLQGDTLFLNEWYPTQLSGLLLYPLLKIVIGITKTTEGLMLTFRYIYLILQLLTSIILYLSLKKHSELGAMIGSILFFVFVPHAIMALSYNSMGVMTLAVSLTLFSVSENKMVNVISGVFLSFSVLCCPYLAVLYGLYLIIVIINLKFRKSEDLFSFKKFIYVTIGVALVFVIFVAYILKHMTIQQFFNVLPYTLNIHDTYKLNIVAKMMQLINELLLSPNIIKASLFLYLASSILGHYSKNKIIKSICFLIVTINSIFNLYCVVLSYAHINYLMFTPFFTGLSLYLIYGNRSVKKLFYGILLPTVIYCLCIHFSSNQVLGAVSQVTAVSIAPSIVIMFVTYRDNVKEHNIIKKCSKVFIVLFILFQLYEQLSYRIKVIPFDTGMEDQTIIVENGINKGLMVSIEKNHEWNDYEYDVSLYVKDSNVLFIADQPWLYLINDYRNCSYSAWPVENMEEHLLDYYKINRNKLPNEIYVDSKSGRKAKKLVETYGYKLKTVTDLGNYVYQK